jgi:hypothetical protein
VAKLVARLLGTAALWVRIQTFSVIQNGRHKHGSGQHTQTKNKLKAGSDPLQREKPDPDYHESNVDPIQRFLPRTFCGILTKFSRQNKKGIVFYFSGRLPVEEPPGCVPLLKKSRQGAFLS